MEAMDDVDLYVVKEGGTIDRWLVERRYRRFTDDRRNPLYFRRFDNFRPDLNLKDGVQIEIRVEEQLSRMERKQVASFNGTPTPLRCTIAIQGEYRKGKNVRIEVFFTDVSKLESELTAIESELLAAWEVMG